MAIVTGLSKDIRLQSARDVALRLRFSLRSTDGTAAFIGSTLVSPVDRFAEISAFDGFSIDLASTDLMTGNHYYVITAEWLDPIAGWSPAEFMEWEIRVPVNGGPLSALVDMPIGGGEVWIVPGGAIPPLSNPGDMLYDPLTDDFFTLS